MGFSPSEFTGWPSDIITNLMAKAAHVTIFKRSHDDKSSAESFGKKRLKINKRKKQKKKINKINILPELPRVMWQLCSSLKIRVSTGEFHAQSQQTKTQNEKSELLPTCCTGQRTDSKNVESKETPKGGWSVITNFGLIWMREKQTSDNAEWQALSQAPENNF